MMNRGIRLLLTLGLLLITAHHVPAPISEVPEPTATSKAKPKKAKTQGTSAENESRSQPAAKTAPTPAVSFAGTWTGTVNGQAYSFLGSDDTTSFTYSIQISPDERTISVGAKGDSLGHLRKLQIACRREGDTLAWNYKQTGFFSVPLSGTCTLRINSNGTADLAEERTHDFLEPKRVYKITGTLVRQ